VLNQTVVRVAGFPRSIVSDHPPVMHADQFWEVESLTPL
jgi:hypothetical protein